jgi:hypothetical protein
MSNAFYDDHAEQYAADSAGIDLRALYDVFLPLVPPGGHLLDAGCGAGSTAWVNAIVRATG